MSKRKAPIQEEPGLTAFTPDADVRAIIERQKENFGSSFGWTINTAIRFWNEWKDKAAELKAA